MGAAPFVKRGEQRIIVVSGVAAYRYLSGDEISVAMKREAWPI